MGIYRKTTREKQTTQTAKSKGAARQEEEEDLDMIIDASK
jgi:hypothetical protein